MGFIVFAGKGPSHMRLWPRKPGLDMAEESNAKICREPSSFIMVGVTSAESPKAS